MLKKIFRQLHKWIGILSGIVIMIVCLTGALLSFERELIPLLNRQIYDAEQTAENQISLRNLSQKISEQMPGRELATITRPFDFQRNWSITFCDEPGTSYYVNPSSGIIVGSFTYKGSFFSIVRELHRYLLMGKVGRFIVGSCTLFFTILLITGLLVKLPFNRKRLSQLFRLDINGNRFRKIYQLHWLGGLLFFFFLLTCSLTGPFWSFEWYRNTITRLCGATPGITSQNTANTPTPSMLSLTDANWTLIENQINVMLVTHNNVKEIRIQLPQINHSEYTIATIPQQQLHARQTDTYTYRFNDGTLVNTSIFKNKPLSQTFRIWVFALHTGSWGGFPMKLAYCIASIIGFGLSLTGYLMWWSKKRKFSKCKIK